MWKFPLFEALAAFGQPPVVMRAARRRPLSRHYRNPQDPHQAARIEAARRKRERKAAKLDKDTEASYFWNSALDHVPVWIGLRRRPFYIAK